MRHISNLLPFILSVFSYFIPICCFLPFPLKTTQKINLFLILLVNILLIGYVMGTSGVILLLISCSIYITYIDQNKFLNISVFLFTYLFCVLWDNALSLLWDSFISPISTLKDSTGLYILYIITYIVLLSLVCPLISRCLHAFIHKIQTKPFRQLTLLIFFNLMICLIIFLFNIIGGESIGYTRHNITFNCILFAIYFGISTVLIYYMIKTYTENICLQQKQESYEILQRYTKQIEDMYLTLRSFKHDYNNIMLSMTSLIEAEDIQGLKSYFDKEILPLNKKLAQTSTYYNQLMNFKNTEVRSVIMDKLLYALEKKIFVSLEIIDEIENLPIESVDLSRVIGIFWDNAIEASLETETPQINFAIIKTEDEICIIISNSFTEHNFNHNSLNKPFTSSKGENHGIGLHSAKKILSKYDSILWDTRTDNHLFIQQLWFKKR